MKMIEPSATLIAEKNPLKRIELIGRVCYKSEDKITEGSCWPFVRTLVSKHHFAMLEHARVTFEIVGIQQLPATFLNMPAVTYTFKDRPAAVKRGTERLHYATLSCSHIFQHEYSDQFPTTLHELIMRMCYICFTSTYVDPEINGNSSKKVSFQLASGKTLEVRIIHQLEDIYQSDREDLMLHGYASVHFICDRGVSHELVRHRCAVAQESTRYCNYSSDKFGSTLTFVKPACWEQLSAEDQEVYRTVAETATESYMKLLQHNKPEIARAVLPNMLKTEVVLTMPNKQWIHFFNLRSRGLTGAPHPDMKVIADQALRLVEDQIYLGQLYLLHKEIGDPDLLNPVDSGPEQIPLDI